MRALCNVTVERLRGTTDDGLEARPNWRADPNIVTAKLMPPSAQLLQAAALRDERLEQIAVFERGVNLSSENTRIVSDGKTYAVGRITQTPREVIAELKQA